MRIQTQSLGAVEAGPDSFLTLPDGILGFEEHHEFVLVRPESHAPFRWLLSFSDPELAFPVLEPRLVAPDYAPAISAPERRALGAGEGDALELYVLASVDPETRQLTVNLRAPIVVHPATRTAKQVVLSDGRWSVEHVVGGKGARVSHGREARQAA